MDIERVNDTKNRVTFNHNRDRILFKFIPRLLGPGDRLLFAWKRTFSEDLSEYPLTITLDTIGVTGLHDAIQYRVAELRANFVGRGFQTPELFALEQACSTLAEFNATDIQDAA